MTIKALIGDKANCSLAPTNGIHQGQSNVFFGNLTIELPIKVITSHKSSVSESMSELPRCMVEPEYEKDHTVTNESKTIHVEENAERAMEMGVLTVQFTTSENCKLQMDRDKDVEHESINRLKRDWRKIGQSWLIGRSFR